MQQLLPWTVAALATGILLGVLAALAFGARRQRRRALPARWPLSARPVFSIDERALYTQLRHALPHHVLLAKLPLVRFCQPADPKAVRYWYELLGAQHVSFAVCSPTGRVLVAIDLATTRTPSKRSARIKASVLAACGVRHERFAADKLPSLIEIQMWVPTLAPERLRETPRGFARSTPPGTPRKAATAPLWQSAEAAPEPHFGARGQGAKASPPALRH